MTAMHQAVAQLTASDIRMRRGEVLDIDALEALERTVFATDRISRRGFLRFLGSPTASLIVAERGNAFAGYALVTFRAGSGIARLYSIAVARAFAGRGIGSALITAAEQ